MSFRNVFTTGQAAAICRISQQTIIRCFENGSLKGYKVPASRFRRIPWESLYNFMRSNGLETAIIEHNILLLEDGAPLGGLAHEFSLRMNGHPGKIVRVPNLVELGAKAAECPPVIVVLDCRNNLPSDSSIRALLEMKAAREKMNLPLVIVALAKMKLSGLIATAASFVETEPIDDHVVAARAVSLLE